MEQSLIERAQRAKSFSVLSAVLQHSLTESSVPLAIANVEAVVRIAKTGPASLATTPSIPSSSLSNLPSIPGLDLPQFSSLDDVSVGDVDMNGFLFVVPDLWKRFVAIATCHAKSVDCVLCVLNAMRELFKSTAKSPKQSSGSQLNTALMTALVKEGVFDAIADMFSYNSNNNAVIEAVFPVINMYAVQDDAYRSMIGKLLGSLIVSVVREKGPQLESIAEIGLRSIINLSRSAEVRELLGQLGVFEVINEMLIFHSKSSAVIAEVGCRAFNNLIYDSETNKNRFVGCSAGQTVVNIMSCITEPAGFRGVACAALQVISGVCLDDKAKSERFVELNAIEAVENVMLVFGYEEESNDAISESKVVDQEVIDFGLQALDILCDDDGEEQAGAVAAAQVTTADSGITVDKGAVAEISAVIDSVSLKSGDVNADATSVQDVKPKLKLSDNPPKPATPPVDLAAISRLVDTSLSAPSAAVVAECMANPISNQSEVVAVSVLVSISRLCDGSAFALAEFGAIPNFFPNLTYMLRAHFNSTVVAEKALCAVKFLCRYGDAVSTSNKANAAALGEADMCQVAVDLIKNHGFIDVEVALQGVCCIRNLTVNPQNMLRLGSAGACSLVVDLIKTHGYTNSTFAEQALRSIVNLAINDVNRELLGTVGACVYVVEMLKVHGHQHDGVAEQGLGAIVNLAVVNNNRSLLGSVGACALVVEIIQSHVTALYSNNEVAKQGALAVLNLAWNNSANVRQLHAADAKAVLQLLVLDNISVTNEIAKKNAKEAIAKLGTNMGMMSMFSF